MPVLEQRHGALEGESEGSVVFDGGRARVSIGYRLGMAGFALLVALFVFSLLADSAWAQRATLDITKEEAAGDETVTVGEDLTYTVTVTNTDATDTATDVRLTDPLPNNTTFVSSTPPSVGTCTTPDSGDSSGTIRCNFGNLATGASATVTFTVRPTAEAGDVGFVDNTARARADNADEVQETERTNVDPSGLTISKDDAPNTVEVGGLLLYTLEVTNNTGTNNLDVDVIDELPDEVEFLDADPSQGSCAESNGVVECDINDLDDGETATVQVFVEPQQEGTITNEAQVFFEDDPNTPIDQATENTTVEDDGNNNNNNGNNDNDDDNDGIPNDEDDDDDGDGVLDADEDLEALDDETTDGEGTTSALDDQYGDGEGTTGDGGAVAQSGDPDAFKPETSTRGEVVDEVPTEGPLPNTGGASLLTYALPAMGVLLLGAALLRRFGK